MSEAVEHPFSQYIRILGKGKNTGRSLSRDEAYAAFTLILKEEIEPIQLGAFLLLLRVRGEDENELAGFAEATRHFIAAPAISADIDWPSYAGKHRQQAWYLLAALLLAQNGHRVFIHGSTYQSPDRAYTPEMLAQLGVPHCQNWGEVSHQLAVNHLAYMSLASMCPPLDRLFLLRPVLGVRSPANSLVKLVNPLGASTNLQSVFHPAYLEIHQKAARLLGYHHSLAMKGEGGEIEFRPDADNRLFIINKGELVVEKWARRQAKRQPDLERSQLSANLLKQIWAGTLHDAYAIEAVTGTAAMVLFGSGLAATEDEARQVACDYWKYRNLNYLK